MKGETVSQPTPAELAALERLAKAATPGPWRTVTNRPFGPWDNRDGEPLASDGLPVLVRNWKEVCLNAAFIVALVNAFPALLAAARRGAADTEDAADEELSDELNAHLDTQRALVLLANQLERHSIPFVPEAEAATAKARRDVAEFDELLRRGMEAAQQAFATAKANRAHPEGPQHG